MESSAKFSPCRTWRYELRRRWDPVKRTVVFIGLNPSTADETNDDPTIRRCVGFAKSWGYGGIVMLNLFAYRATDPRDLRDAAEAGIRIVGPENDNYLLGAAATFPLVVAAWGVHGAYLDRGAEVARMIHELHCLGVTKGGHPKHPLYLRADTPLQPFGIYDRERRAWYPRCPHGDVCSGCDPLGYCTREAAA